MKMKDTMATYAKKWLYRRTLFVLTLAFLSLPALAQTARVQVIHNSPYAAASTVDVYINDALAIDDLAFREAAGFLDLTAGAALTIDITAADAADNSNPVFTKEIAAPGLTADETYILTAAGDPTGGDPAFDLFINAMAQESAATTGNAEFVVFHGAPDAPTVDVAARGAGTLVDDISFGEYSSVYVSVPPAVYDVDIMTADGSSTAYAALADLSGAADAALAVLASGFLTPENDDPAFGLLAVFADGSTALLPANTARAQVIHNSPYSAASVVDVYINDALAVDDFAFQSATGFIDLPAGSSAETATDVKIDITGASDADNSSPVFTTTVNLVAGEAYILTAAGDPLGGDPAFNLFIDAMGQEAAMDDGNTDVLVFHGAPDAPTVDVSAAGSPRPLVDDVSFGEYQGYLALPTADYILNVSPGDDNDTVVASFAASLETLALDGAAIVVQASGFLAPAEGDPGFGLIAVTAAGTVVPLEASLTSRVQVIHNSADSGAGEVDIYVSQDGTQIAKLEDVAFRTATAFLDLPSGDLVIDIAPPSSMDVSESIFQKTLSVVSGQTYVVVASGSLSATDDTAFDLFASIGREQSVEEGATDLLIFHGASDAPAVDVVVPGDMPLTLADDAVFGAFVPYQTVPVADYPLDLLTGDGATLVAQFTAPLETLALGDEALAVVASGFLSPEMDAPAFGLFVVLPEGGAFVPLSVVSGVSNETAGSDLPGEFTLYENYPNPFNPTTTLQFDLPAAASVTVEVFDMLGRKVMALPAENRAAGAAQRLQLDASSLASGIYIYQVQARAENANFVSTGRMILLK